MEKTTLSLEDVNTILESLKYTRLKFEDYQGYPSHEFKQGRVNGVNDVIIKVEAIKSEMK
jgi:hypothetical protein